MGSRRRPKYANPSAKISVTLYPFPSLQAHDAAGFVSLASSTYINDIMVKPSDKRMDVQMRRYALRRCSARITARDRNTTGGCSNSVARLIADCLHVSKFPSIGAA